MFKYNNKTYDFLKWLCMLGLPALAIFLTTTGKIWNIEILDPISETVVALNALIAGSLGISTAQYKAEQLEGEENADGNN